MRSIHRPDRAKRRREAVRAALPAREACGRAAVIRGWKRVAAAQDRNAREEFWQPAAIVAVETAWRAACCVLRSERVARGDVSVIFDRESAVPGTKALCWHEFAARNLATMIAFLPRCSSPRTNRRT